MGELTLAIEEETISRDSAKAASAEAEKRANEMAVMVDESGLALEQSERARKLAESAISDVADRLAEVEELYNVVADGKKKAEADFFALQDDIDNLEEANKASEAKAAKAAMDVARAEDDLAAALAKASSAEQSRALLVTQIGELQAQLEAAEAASGRGLKNEIRKLELRICELESDVDSEGRKSLQVAKQARQAEKKVQEVEAALTDEKKAT